MAIVNLQDLQVTFGAKTAVSAASFCVDAGETFSLIGASGCGKSTICACSPDYSANGAAA